MAIDGMAVIEFMGITLDEVIRSRYTHSLLTLVLFFVGAKLITFIAEKYLLKLTEKTKTEVDDLLVKRTHRPISLLLFILGIKIALVPLGLEEKLETMLHHIISTLSILILAFIAMRVVDIIIHVWVGRRAEKKKSEIDENLIKISSKTSRAVFVVLGLLFILKVWNIQIGALLASLGIIGIAVAFGLQNTLGNVFGGVSLLLDRSIKVGDIVKIDEETYGEVLDVGLRATRVRTWDNEVVIIPNGKLAGVNIRNYVLPNPTARITVPFSVAYGSNVDKVKKIVMGEIKKLDNLDKSHDPMVMFLEMGSSSLNFKAFVWVRSYKERFATKEKLNCMIYNALNKNKITIPFPQMDVWIKEMRKGRRK